MYCFAMAFWNLYGFSVTGNLFRPLTQAKVLIKIPKTEEIESLLVQAHNRAPF